MYADTPRSFADCGLLLCLTFMVKWLFSVPLCLWLIVQNVKKVTGDS